MAYDDDDGMPTKQQLAEQHTDEIAAHKIPCTYCGAQTNQPCVNKFTGHELRRFAAHQRRITDAKNKPADDDDFEVPF